MGQRDKGELKIEAGTDSRHWSAAQARKVLAAWKASGKSGSAFAREAGFRAQRLFWWRERLKPAPTRKRRRPALAAPLAFVPVEVRSPPGAPAVVVVCDHVRFEIHRPAEVESPWLSALVLSLRARPA